MQLIVAKCDGSSEVYLHTKVMGSISSALADCDYFEPHLAEDLSEAVTTYIKRRYGCGEVGADEIHSMIEVVLSDIGFEAAALCLHEHRINRQVQRGRTVVLDYGAAELAGMDCYDEFTQPWNKSIIVADLEEKHGMSRGTARSVAGQVEERVLRLGCRTITRSLVGELVANELLVMGQAEKMLLEPIGEVLDLDVMAMAQVV
ncbi:MAG: hypothetical protein JW936_06210 [Sedimentisphaerales bacterium]|nr:hypothetical protein [Sedimentisphaerales bacterium]